MNKLNCSEVRFLGKIRWKQVAMHSIRHIFLLIALFLTTFILVGVGLAIYHSISVEVALREVYISLVAGIPVTIPLAVCGGIFLALVKQEIENSRKGKIPVENEIIPD